MVTCISGINEGEVSLPQNSSRIKFKNFETLSWTVEKFKTISLKEYLMVFAGSVLLGL